MSAVEPAAKSVVGPPVQAPVIEPPKPVEPAPAAVAIKGPRRILPSRFKQAEEIRAIWAICPEEGTQFEDILKPDYWGHISERLRPTSRVEVHPDDGSYYAEIYIRSVGKQVAQVALIRKIEFDQAKASAASDDHKVVWKGPIMKWAVVRSADEKAVVHSGFENKDAAVQWIAVNSRSLAA